MALRVRPIRRRGQSVAAALFAALVFLDLLPAPSHAVDIPFTRVFFGRQFRSFLDDAACYPASFVSVEASYWDIYYDRGGGRLHDYDQRTSLMTAVGRWDRFLLGASTWRDELSLRQENVYTDADRMVGSGSNGGGKVIVGYTLSRDMPLALTSVEMLGAAGSNGAFLGEAELRLSWGLVADLLVKGETVSNALDVNEEINGSRFPFRFPFDTDRWFGRVQVCSFSAFRFRLWGLYETNSGEGEVVQGFENRLWLRRRGVGGSVDYNLEPAHRLYLTPIRSVASAPGMRVRVEYTDADCDVGMHFNGVRYLHLDGLEIVNPIARVDVVPLRGLSLFGGWERLSLGHHGDSFFDIWPFTIWDLFQAKRYRLDDFDSTLDTWFVGAAGRFERKPILAELSGRFEWWDGGTSFDWLERIDVLFPFFFRYERHSESYDLGTDYALQVDAALWWRFGDAASLRLSGRATVPLQGDAGGGGGSGPPPAPGEPPPPGAGSESTHGGVIGTIELVIGK